ncbi:hypothetical protein [Nonomuraea sp. NEAU-A123]|uniref:hypothetical protein n=1 Tax=Nonomuraea sp. NEAU-A123 TaxID=2839649 RepID=UPI001BE3E512|nr:hypothetical protein [Nonomuraea sp. NEAU-A123]MBT2226558.1 hypothetical protein [Nonomuraea sp. NEAU-A123]
METVRLGAGDTVNGVVSRPLRQVLGAVLAVLGLLWAQCPAVFAGTQPPTPGFSLQVSPTRLVVPAGTISTAQHFEVRNGGRSSYDVTVEKADFVTDEHGAMNFQPQAPYAAASWVSVRPAHFRLVAGATKTVTMRIAMPDEPEPGDHQLALIFKVPAGRNADNIRINRGIAAPVFITVPGPIDSSVEVTDLRAPGFVMHGPVPITTKIHDLGTVHHDFRGSGRLRVRIGSEEIAFPDFTVLRGATREVTTNWDPPLMCICHATVSIVGAGGQTHGVTVRIITFPVHLLGILLATIAMILLLGWFVRRRYRAKVRAAAAALYRDGPHA